jgi:hypothetical protein
MSDIVLARRIAARRWAEECFAAADDKGAFAERVCQLAGIGTDHPKPRVMPPPMTSSEAKAFEARTIRFGVYVGTPICNVPLSYLAHLTDPSPEMDQFFRDVKRYLRNPAVQRMMED